MDEYLELEHRLLALIRGEMISESVFNDHALAIYRYQRRFNQPYANYCEFIGAPENPEEWRFIPAMPQSGFKQFPLRSFPEELTSRTFRTSGTTGEGFGMHHFRSLILYAASVMGAWKWFDLPRLRQIVLAQSPAQVPDSSLAQMISFLSVVAAGQVFVVNDAGDFDLSLLRNQLDARPALVFGTALAFLHLCDSLEAENIRLNLPEGSFAMETGGYKGSRRIVTKSVLYNRIARTLSVSPEMIINEYGMTELSSQFYATGPKGLHRPPPWMRALVINPESGREAGMNETGTLRIFDLANLGSVMAIETRDLAIRRDDGFELIGCDPAATPRGCSRAADEMLGG
jgi:hypothetical protein